MKNLKHLFDFYIFSNIHVAITAWCLTKITLLEFGIVDYKIALFVCLSTIVSYNFIRFYRIEEIDNWFADWLNTNKKYIIIIIILSIILLGYLSFFINIKAIIVLVPFVFFTIFYVIPFSKKKKSKVTLRKVVGLKIFLIAISWAGVTVLFPLVQFNVSLNSNVWITFFQRFLFVMLLIIPFDIRDLYIDSKSMKTIPQVIGVKKTKILSIFLIVLVFLLEYIKGSTTYNLLIILFVLIVLLVLILMGKKQQDKYYSAFWVEAIPILWWVLLIVKMH